MPHEKPPQWESQALQPESGPHSPQLEKRPHSNKDPSQTKHKSIITKKNSRQAFCSCRFPAHLVVWCSFVTWVLLMKRAIDGYHFQVLPYKAPRLEQPSPCAGWMQMAGPQYENTPRAPEGSCGAGLPCSPLQLSYKLGRIDFLS